MRSRRVWVILIPILLMLAAGRWWIRRAEEANWREMQGVIAAFGEGDSMHRVRLFDGPGYAECGLWDAYLEALMIYRDLPPLIRRTLGELWGRKESSLSATENLLLDSMAPAFERLVAGAHSSEVLKISRNSDLSVICGHAQAFGKAVALEAARQGERGNTRKAIELLVGLAQFGGDIGTCDSVVSEYIGYAIIGYSIDGLERLLRRRGISGSDMADLLRYLERLERSIPLPDHAMLHDIVSAGASMIADDFTMPATLADPRRAVPAPTWRHAYSTKLLLACSFLEAHQLALMTSSLHEQSYDEERLVWGDILARCQRSENVIVEALVADSEPWTVRRELVAQVRLLRLGYAFVNSGGSELLRDPFGGDMKKMSGPNGEVVLWSVGRDGRDDAAKGGWSRGRDGDIVLTVDRR